MDYSSRARLVAALIALTAAVTLATHINIGLTRHPDRTLFVELWRTGRYFTILTTFMVVVLFARVAFSGRLTQGWAAGIALWTAIVSIVYHALLARELSGLRLYVDHGMHTVIPIAVALWWLAFAQTSALRYTHSAWWLLWPGLYMGYALLRGEIDGRHPYFFLDPPLIGWPKVLMWIPTLALVFWVSGLGLIWLGRRINRDRPDREDAARGDLQPR
ncbi:Pr6Pr family membrane protein [Pacificoceanicola onchidii]|uniref:Pr6Pr family membrane protein n=1 Tax=Pacificoceanicola onchidii TaxID=2562685 RepID=UPI00145604CA|nr:Pr6Pr family membrane protein [Pacificoceanicola onchidii]